MHKTVDMVEYAFFMLSASDNIENSLSYKRILELLHNVLANTDAYFTEWTCFHSFQSGSYSDDVVTYYLERGRRFQLFTDPQYAALYARGMAGQDAFYKCKPILAQLAEYFDALEDKQDASFAVKMAECFFGLAFTLATEEEHRSALRFVANLRKPVND